VLPIASAGGPAIIAVAVSASTLLAWWLVRAESRDDAAEDAEAEAAGNAEQDGVSAP
jgi:hypothetical protein